jgi:hypothetical protein
MSIYYLFNFISNNIGPFEVALIPHIVLIIRGLLRKTKNLSINKKNIPLILFLLITLIPLVINITTPYFDASEFLLSYLKLLSYTLSFLIGSEILFSDIEKLKKTMKISLLLISLFGIYQYIVHLTGVSLPYNYSNAMVSYGIFRINSIFAEPSLFLFVVVQYFFLVLNDVKFNTTENLIICISVVLTFSLTVYGLFLMSFFIIRFINNKNVVKVFTTVVVVFSIMMIAYISIPLIQNHINNLISFKPSSATNRMFGGFLYSFTSPIEGIGLGNFKTYYQNSFSNIFREYTINGEVNNIFSTIRLSSGLMGFFVFLIFLFNKYWKHSRKFLMIFLFSFLAWGNFNSAGFFFMLMLLEMDLRKRKLTFKKEQITYE